MNIPKLFKSFSTHTKFCIIGGGTGGLNLSAHLLRERIPATDIRIFDPSPKHYYQPGWTMVGANLCTSDLTEANMKEVLPSDINKTTDKVVNVDAEKRTIKTANGQEWTYDQLIFASGLEYNWQKIKGAKELLDDPHSNVGTIYTKEYAEKTARIGQQFKGGKAIFTEPPMPIKCAGAPQKILYLWADQWKKAGVTADVQFYKAVGVMFGVPKYSEALTRVAQSHNIKTSFFHNLVEVTPKNAVFQHAQTKQRIQKDYDFLHLVPPMSAHSYISQSGLADKTGYLDVDKQTLRHVKYQNIWGIGDCTNTPNSKTAAAIFSQTLPLVKNILTAERNANAQLPGKYDGYASCPLFVGGGKLLLAEFKYGGIVDETFYHNQQVPRRIFYYLKRYGFPAAYWQLVPRGLWGGRKGLHINGI